MIATGRNCLQTSELELVVNGEFPADEFDSAISHLDNCERCRQAIEGLQREGKWLQQSLIDEGNDPLQAETACQVALWQMLETPVAPVDDLVSAAVPKDCLGPYRLLRPLGTGGMGTVYLAEHQRLRRRCAIKLLPRERVDQPGWLDRFDREMTTVASLEHTNIVRANDAGHEDGWHYLVMEHLDGLDVGRIAGRMGPLEVADACEIVRQAALGLAHVHSSGLVHRDVKPSNLMLTHDGVVKLLDLGLVLSGDDPLAVDDRLTTVGHLMGTMPYMAPEQLMDSRDVDPRADIYSLGATLFRLIAGKPPHPRRGGLAQHVMAITKEDPPRLDSVREDVDREVVELVAEMLSRDPGKRPRQASEVAQRLAPIGRRSAVARLLRQALRKRSTDESPPSVLPSAANVAPPDNRRGQKWLAGAAMGLMILLAGFVLKIATDRGDLIVKSEHDDLVVAVKRGDDLVERLRISSDGENRLTLHKGTYTIEIENAPDGLSLDKDVVTIGRGQSSPVKVQQKPGGGDDDSSSAPAMLYQGKELSDWRNLLKREQDPDALGKVMQAVEVLTREGEMREEVVKETLVTARTWGGFVAGGGGQFGGSDDPSQLYMNHLLETFPSYLPQPGLRAINFELQSGNDHSRTAVIWLLHNAVQESQWAREGQRMFQPFQGVEGKELLESLYENLRLAVAEIDNSDIDNSNLASSSPSNMGRLLGLKLRILMNKPIADQPWLCQTVRQRLDESVATWKQGKPNPVAGGGGMFGAPSWLVPEDVLVAAVELDGTEELDAPWEFIAAVLIDGQYRRISERSNQVFDAVATNAAEPLLAMLEKRLVSFHDQASAGGSAGQTQGGFSSTSAFSAVPWSPVFSLCDGPGSIWSKALSFYAEHAKVPAASAALLKDLRSGLVQLGVEQLRRDEPFADVDAAIAKLNAKAATKAQ